MSTRLPTYFLSHGGGPWPYLDGPFRRAFDQLEKSLVDIRRELGDAPRAVLVISGHWEEDGFAISSGEEPGMVYDYSGFPEHTYHIRYKAPGSPELHLQLGRLLAPLRDEGVLIIGSGLSYHNLARRDRAAIEPSQAFDAWLQETLASTPEQRTPRLIHWERAPLARAAHPQEDHLIPLMAAVGAAED